MSRNHAPALARPHRLQAILDPVVKHAEGNHWLVEGVGPRHYKRLDVGEQIKSLEGAGDRVGHDLAGEVCDVDAVPRVALAVVNIRGDSTH